MTTAMEAEQQVSWNAARERQRRAIAWLIITIWAYILAPVVVGVATLLIYPISKSHGLLPEALAPGIVIALIVFLVLPAIFYRMDTDDRALLYADQNKPSLIDWEQGYFAALLPTLARAGIDTKRIPVYLSIEAGWKIHVFRKPLVPLWLTMAISVPLGIVVLLIRAQVFLASMHSERHPEWIGHPATSSSDPVFLYGSLIYSILVIFAVWSAFAAPWELLQPRVSLAVSQVALRIMNGPNSDLAEAVLAHELSHIRNKDPMMKGITKVFIGSSGAFTILLALGWFVELVDSFAGNVPAHVSILCLSLGVLGIAISLAVHPLITTTQEIRADLEAATDIRRRTSLIKVLEGTGTDTGVTKLRRSLLAGRPWWPLRPACLVALNIVLGLYISILVSASVKVAAGKTFLPALEHFNDSFGMRDTDSFNSTQIELLLRKESKRLEMEHRKSSDGLERHPR